MDNSKALFTIRIVAEVTGLHPQTIRTYEQKGLVSPQRTSGGTRMYSTKDVELIEEIQELSNNGVGIEGISRILALQNRIFELESQVEELMMENQRLRTSASVPSPTTAIIVHSSIPYTR